MKARVLRVLEEHQEVIKHIKLDGDGKKFLADNGEYISAGSGMEINNINVSSNNQQVVIQATSGTLYLIDTGNYAGTTVKINASGVSNDIVVKNIGNVNSLTFITALDNKTNQILDPLNAVRLIWNSSKWFII